MTFKKYEQHQSFRFPAKCPQPPFGNGEMTPPMFFRLFKGELANRIRNPGIRISTYRPSLLLIHRFNSSLHDGDVIIDMGPNRFFSNSIRFQISNLIEPSFKPRTSNRIEPKATEPNFEFFSSFLVNVPLFAPFSFQKSQFFSTKKIFLKKNLYFLKNDKNDKVIFKTQKFSQKLGLSALVRTSNFFEIPKPIQKLEFSNLN